MTSVPFFLLFFAIVVIFAMLRGGWPERTTAFAYMLALAGTASGGFLRLPGNFQDIPVHMLVADALLLIAVCIVAIHANRWWPIPAAGCQLTAVLVHAGKLINPEMIPNGYAFLTTIWSWPMVFLLGLGTWAHRRRLKAGIFVFDWKPSSVRRRSPTLSGRRTV